MEESAPNSAHLSMGMLKSGGGLVSSTSGGGAIASEDDAGEYDADNYASIDSQLGKYDVNFKASKGNL